MMLTKPAKCCDPGSYECQVPMPINGRIQGIDLCIADIVASLNACNIITVASCCGHGRNPAIISLEDGREIKIKNPTKSKTKAKPKVDTVYDPDSDLFVHVLQLSLCELCNFQTNCGTCKKDKHNAIDMHRVYKCDWFIPSTLKCKTCRHIERPFKSSGDNYPACLISRDINKAISRNLCDEYDELTLSDIDRINKNGRL